MNRYYVYTNGGFKINCSQSFFSYTLGHLRRTNRTLDIRKVESGLDYYFDSVLIGEVRYHE